MKLIILLFLKLILINSFSHEGGHGELAESGKFGGVTAPVVDQIQAGMGNKGKVIFKSELVRNESGKLSLYLFDEKMKLINLNELSNEVIAKLEFKKKGKFTYFGEFKLTKHGNHYMGQLPELKYRPFNIDLFFSKGDKKLFVGFSNLD
jgi:hypothetical protein